MFVTVVTASRSGQIGYGLTYRTDKPLRIGQLVRVPLRTALVEGIVLEINVNKPDADAKEVRDILSSEPLIPESIIKLMHELSEYYMCSPRQMLTAILPEPPWRLMLSPVDRTVHLINKQVAVRGSKQHLVIDLLMRTALPLDDVIKETGATMATLKSLERKNIISISETPKREILTKQIWSEKIDHSFDPLFSIKRPSLLFDKTYGASEQTVERLLQSALKSGKSVLLICPEISDLYRWHARFKRRAILLGSDLTPTQERQALRAIARSRNQLIIGTRSAIFAPITDLGLTLVLDEHNEAYKNEKSPKYHVREAAVMRSRIEGHACVFISKTPSLEAFTFVAEKKWHRATLKNQSASDDIRVVDLSSSRTGKWYPLSSELVSKLKQQIDRKETSLLYLNQRGFATALLCAECRQFAASSQTGLPLTVHKDGAKQLLIDHQSNAYIPVPSRCPQCGSANMTSIGAGTQKVEQLLRSLFPKASILRFDRDALKRRQDVKNAYEEMKHRNFDIVIGTTTVLRMLSDPSVTFACAVLADIGLSIPHFRAGERTFHTLHRIVNSMKGKKRGCAMLQTFRPLAREIDCAAKSDAETYLTREYANRVQFDYPPSTKMIALIFRGREASLRAENVFSALQINDVKVQKYPLLYEPDVWLVTVRGSDPRSAIAQVDLRSAIVDVDPLTLI